MGPPSLRYLAVSLVSILAIAMSHQSYSCDRLHSACSFFFRDKHRRQSILLGGVLGACHDMEGGRTRGAIEVHHIFL